MDEIEFARLEQLERDIDAAIEIHCTLCAYDCCEGCDDKLRIERAMKS